MRTSRLVGAMALLVTVVLPVRADAQLAPKPDPCPPAGLGPPTACVGPVDGGPSTSLGPDARPGAHPGPALWVGAVFGVAGLGGIAFATVRVRNPEPVAPG